MTSQISKTTRGRHRPSGQKWDIRVRLILGGFANDPDELTKVVGIEPTEVKRRGDPVSWATSEASASEVPRVKSNFWILESPSERTETLVEQTRELLNLVATAAKAFRNLPIPDHPTISCVIYDYTREVVLEFPADVVTGAAAIGADIDVDYYDLSAVGAEKRNGP
jgi:hypothetical protein